jgi:hypothetical protein
MIEKNRIFVIDNKRIAFLLIFVFMFFLTEIGRKIYRPFIYSNDIFDYWIADTIGNLTGTIAIVFFDFAIVNPNRRNGRIFIVIITLGLIVYELLQYFSPRSILDWRDMIATVIAGLVSWGIYEILIKTLKEEEISPPDKTGIV